MMRISGQVVRGLVALAFGAGLAGSGVGCSDGAKQDGSAAATDVQQQKVQDSMKDFMAKKSVKKK